MGTTLHNFINIFSSKFQDGEEEVAINKIVIPIIQRDYAQGRISPEINRIRTRFLNSLYEAVVGNNITLDFIYGNVENDGTMTPLDGQQRLTTLFLLHWYSAQKEKLDNSQYSFLGNFSYETRYSAREFCKLLVEEHRATFEKKLSDEIIDQHWFPLEWRKDTTIESMLVVLDAIHEKFSDVPNLWDRLNNGAISFYFLPISQMGLTDELYIKMNSRGKPLSAFEHFKAELEKELRSANEETAKRIIKKIDIDWTDLLWQYKGEDNVIDDEFLCYFRFICDIICYRSGDTRQGKSSDEFDLISDYFSAKSENFESNIALLESFFDCWLKVENPEQFLGNFITNKEHESGKVKIDSRYNIDIFHDCLRTNVASDARNRPFPLNKIILLFAIVTYLQNKECILDEDFSHRLRVVNNLVQNSSDEISDSDNRTAGNRMPTILRQVEEIMLNGRVLEDIGPSFNTFQLSEEKEKFEWVKENAEYKNELFRLEDHYLLYGQISVVGLENAINFSKFHDLFLLELDLADRALMSIGDFSQQERNGWRYQLASKVQLDSWKYLFHKSSSHGFDETKRVLNELLSTQISSTSLNEKIENYLKFCQETSTYDFRYYYLKYDLFRPYNYGKNFEKYYGKYSWVNKTETPYDVIVMNTKSSVSEYSYNPFLKAVHKKGTLNFYGKEILLNKKIFYCTNNSYVLKDSESGEILKEIEILQSNGIDSEDRILKMRTMFDEVIEG